LSGLQLLTTQRYQLVADFTPLQAGAVVSLAAVCSLPSALLGGSFLHRIGLRPLISGGLGLIAVGLAVIATGFQNGLGWVLLGMVIVGVGTGAAMSVASTAILNNVPPRRAGMASSVEEVAYEFGSLLGVALLGSMSAALYIAFVPSGMPAVAYEGLTQAVHAAGSMTNVTWLIGAHAAYDRGYQIVLLFVSAVILASSALTAHLLRGAVGSAAGSMSRVK